MGRALLSAAAGHFELATMLHPFSLVLLFRRGHLGAAPLSRDHPACQGPGISNDLSQYPRCAVGWMVGRLSIRLTAFRRRNAL